MKVAQPRVALALVAIATAGCKPPLSLPGTGGSLVPTLAVNLGTVDTGDGKPFRVSIPANEKLKRLFGGDTVLQPLSSAVDLQFAGEGPGYVLLAGSTHNVVNCTNFGTAASVIRNGEEVLRLDLKATVRRAFEIVPIAEGSRYELKIPPGFRPPIVVDHSDGIVAKVVPTGTRTAELIVTRERPALVPGGMVRLIDRESRDSQTILLPMPPLSLGSRSTGSRSDDRHGEMVVHACSALTPDKPDVDVVLDPPGAYEIRGRSYVNGKLTLTLGSLTRSPVDFCVGFRRKGKWVEVQRWTVN